MNNLLTRSVFQQAAPMLFNRGASLFDRKRVLNLLTALQPERWHVIDRMHLTQCTVFLHLSLSLQPLSDALKTEVNIPISSFYFELLFGRPVWAICLGMVAGVACGLLGRLWFARQPRAEQLRDYYTSYLNGERARFPFAWWLEIVLMPSMTLCLLAVCAVSGVSFLITCPLLALVLGAFHSRLGEQSYRVYLEVLGETLDRGEVLTLEKKAKRRAKRYGWMFTALACVYGIVPVLFFC